MSPLPGGVSTLTDPARGDRVCGAVPVFYLGNCAGSRSYWFNHSGEAPLFRPTSVRNAVKEQDRFSLGDYAMA